MQYYKLTFGHCKLIKDVGVGTVSLVLMLKSFDWLVLKVKIVEEIVKERSLHNSKFCN